MIQVACPSCRANYDVDERRIPATGLRMRCPKCSSSFLVDTDGSTRAAPAVAPPPPPPGARPKPALDDELGLPAPKGAALGGFGELDLPAPKGAAPSRGLDDLDLPAPKGAAPSRGLDDLDLPAPKGAAPSRGLDDLGLSTPRGATGGGLGELDLPAPKGAPLGGFGDLDLPAPKGAAPSRGLDDLDLPAPKAGGSLGELDLPTPKAGGLGELDLPARKPGGTSGLDLPMPKAGGLDLDLPTPKAGGLGGLDLPKPKLGGDFQLDMPGSRSPGSLDELDVASPDIELDVPAPGTRARGLGVSQAKAAPAANPFAPLDLGGPKPAAPAKDPFGDLDLGGPKPAASSAVDFGDLDLGGPKPVASAPLSGELDLGGPKPAAKDPFGELDLGGGGDELALPEPRARGRAGGGGAAFGELDLGGDGDSGGGSKPPVDLDDALEFGGLGLGSDLPGLDDVAPIVRESTVVSELSIAERKAIVAAQRKARAKRVLIGTGIGLAVFAGAGYALKFTPYGVFGQFALERYLPEAGTPSSATRPIEAAERALAADTYDGARDALETLSEARRREGLNRSLLARSLMHSALYVARFGDDSAASASMTAITSRLRDRAEGADSLLLAQAAVALANGDVSGAEGKLTAARRDRSTASDTYFHILSGEVALAGERWDDAAAAFQRAGRKGGARALWGVARALVGKSDEGAVAAIDAVLAASPRHVEARIEKAEYLVRTGEIDAARALAREAAGLEPVGRSRLASAPKWHAVALTLLGRIEELRAHRGDARYAYDAAAEIDGFNLDALVGSGRVQLEGGLYREALVRFQSAIETRSEAVSQFAFEADPRPLVVDAHFGAVRALLALERPNEATPHLEELVRRLPEDPQVAIVRGRVLHAQHRTADAEAAFRKAIELAPSQFDGYLALAQMYFQLERPDDAAATLASAQGHVEVTSEVRRLEGEIEMQRGRLSEARAKFMDALRIQPDDRAARFQLGVAYRREGLFADAARVYDELNAVDSGYPGLALERGQIYEAMGRADEAVRMYQRALVDRADDIELRIRLGGAQVVAGMLDDAERTLTAALTEQPNNANAIHYKGRLELARGNVDLAIQLLQSAVRLEASRAEYRVWLAAAHFEKNNLPAALTEIRATLERDPSSVDGHLLNARLLARSGHLDEALAEVAAALQIDPRRTEAWAVVSECEEQRGRRPQAIGAMRSALGADPNRGDWWSRLGRLQSYEGDSAGAMASYSRAAQLGEGRTPPPAWAYDAHRAIGAIALERGDRAGAAVAYRRFLELAPPTAPGRNEVTRALSRL